MAQNAPGSSRWPSDVVPSTPRSSKPRPFVWYRPQPEVPLTDDERTELTRLRRENRERRRERDILKKAAVFFAKHSE